MCSCAPNYIGRPPSCHPECIQNSDCETHLACINDKCRDPCPGLCGINAECRVILHMPQCVCVDGYMGDAYSHCRQIIQSKINMS